MFNPRENDLHVYVHLPALEQEEFLMLLEFKLAINNRFVSFRFKMYQKVPKIPKGTKSS